MPDQPSDFDHLPDDPALLKGVIRELLTTVRQQQRRIEQLEHQVHLLTKRLYGPRADRIRPDQPTLFGDSPPNDTPTTPPEPESPPQNQAESTIAHKPKGHGRNGLPANLKRVTEIVDVPDAVKQATGGVWVKIGEEVSEQLDYTPSSLFVRQIIRPKYAVRFDAKPDQLRIAELPLQAMPRCKAAPGLVADVIVSKLVDHLPLYRQELRYARQGVNLARSNRCPGSNSIGETMADQLPQIPEPDGLPDDIRQRIVSDFGPERADEIYRNLLDRIPDGLPNGTRPRHLRCILYLAKGDLAELDRYIEICLQDTRDVMLQAEYEQRSVTRAIRVRNFARPFDQAEIQKR